MIEKPDNIRRAMGRDRRASKKNREPSRSREGLVSAARGVVSVTLCSSAKQAFRRRFRGRDFTRPDPGYRCYKVVLRVLMWFDLR
jgi:hypothetical protein